MDRLASAASRCDFPVPAWPVKTQSLIGKKLAIIPDARFNTHGADPSVERLLSISGEDGINISRKHLEDWNGNLGIRFMLLSNALPTLTDASGVIASRFILIRLRRSFFGSRPVVYHRSIVYGASRSRTPNTTATSFLKKIQVDKEDCADAMVAAMCCLVTMTGQTMASPLIQPTPAIPATKIKPPIAAIDPWRWD